MRYRRYYVQQKPGGFRYLRVGWWWWGMGFFLGCFGWILLLSPLWLLAYGIWWLGHLVLPTRWAAGIAWVVAIPVFIGSARAFVGFLRRKAAEFEQRINGTPHLEAPKEPDRGERPGHAWY